VEFQCEFEIGDERLLAHLIDVVLSAARARPLSIDGWSLRPIVPRYGLGAAADFSSLFAKLPVAREARFFGQVREALLALPIVLRDAMQAISLLECGAALSGLDVLRDAASLESIEISGANNVRPPWSKHDFPGFSSLERIRLDEIAALQAYEYWIAPAAAGISRKLPIVEIGDVMLPPVSGDRRIAFGDHVRFTSNIEVSIKHWIRHAPAYLLFRDACMRGLAEYKVPPRCSPSELMAVLGSSSSVSTLDCRDVDTLSGWDPMQWLPERLGLGAGSPSVEVVLPELLVASESRDPRSVEDECDRFVESLEQRARQFGENRRVHVVIDGSVSTRFRAWKWLLDESKGRESEGRLTLGVTDHAETLPPCVGREVSLDLSIPAQQTLCRLLGKRGVGSDLLDRLCIIGSLDPVGHEVIEHVFDALPGLQIHIAAQLTGGVEWLLGSFVCRALAMGRQLTLSAEAQGKLAELDCEKREYEEAARWALREVTQ
jgi:hypothetical protein